MRFVTGSRARALVEKASVAMVPVAPVARLSTTDSVVVLLTTYNAVSAADCARTGAGARRSASTANAPPRRGAYEGRRPSTCAPRRPAGRADRDMKHRLDVPV